MLARLHRLLLELYRRLPRKARRWVVRLVAPSYTVGSIVLIGRPDGHVLLVRQAYRSGWGVPGGLLNRGEDAAHAAVREVLEEVGLRVVLDGEPALVLDAEAQRVDVVYRAHPASLAEVGELRISTPEIVDARWFPPDALPELQVETASALVALARSSRAPQAPPLVVRDAGPYRDRG